MSNKIRNFSKKSPKFKVEHPEEISAEDMKYLEGTPTRMEVANYVNSLWEQEYYPLIMSTINGVSQGAKLGVMIMQAILIEKNIVTGEEIEQLTKEFMERFTQEQEKLKKKAKEQQEKTEDIKDDKSAEDDTPAE